MKGEGLPAGRPAVRPVAPPSTRRVAWLLFAAMFLAYGWFHQGGGWNQNARFAMVRAVVEEGHLWIDSFLIYAGEPTAAGTRLVRAPIRDGRFTAAGARYALRWRDPEGRPVGLGGDPADGDGPEPGTTWVEPEQVASTADISWSGGHFHPAKAPGGSLAAVPAYALLRSVERVAGADPDGWWVLTLNAWLTSALTVGLVAALGCVLFFRLALDLSGAGVRPALLAAVALGLGTLYFPYATAFYEHDLIAVALLAAFFLLHRVKRSDDEHADGLGGRARLDLVLAGLCAGLAAVANYVMAVVVLLLAAYLVLGVRRRGGLRWYALGVLGPFLLLCAYNQVCFGTPFTTNYRYENPVFQDGGGALLGVFGWPSLDILTAALISPFRGLLLGAPVLVLGFHGLATWLRAGHTRAEAWLIVAVVAFFLLFVSSFNGWHGGWASGPRYLVPAIPFLALPVVVSFGRFPRTSMALGGLSVLLALLVTAVDPQAPVGVARPATLAGRPQWLQSPVADYAWPIFTEGRAGPILRAQRDEVLRFQDRTLEARGVPAPMRAGPVARLAAQIDQAVEAGEPAPLLLTTGPGGEAGLALSELPALDGPVSVNPVGFYEGAAYRVFPRHSAEARLNSFNAGELLFPGRRWSLLPLLLLVGGLLYSAVRLASRLDAADPPHGPDSSQPASRNR